MMKRDQPLLDIRPCPHLLCRAKQHPDLPGAHLAEQLFFLHLGICGMDVCDLLSRDALGDQLIAQVIIDIKLAVPFGGAEITEHHLR